MKKLKKCSICGETGHNKTYHDLVDKDKSNDHWQKLEWNEDLIAMKVVEDHPKGMTLEMIGEVMGLTRERIRQIEVVAMRKIRNEKNLKDYAVFEGYVFAVCICSNCGEYFVRDGKKKLCSRCYDPIPKKIRSRVLKDIVDNPDKYIDDDNVFDFVSREEIDISCSED